jgi:hypothetical protein
MFHQTPSYEEAKALIAGHVSSHKSYKEFVKNYSHYKLPSNPNYYYKGKGWVSSSDYFGIPKRDASEQMNNYWREVKLGLRKRNCPAKYKTKKSQILQSNQVNDTTVILAPVVVQEPDEVTYDDKQTFIKLVKKLGIYDEVKPAFRRIFTYEELLDLVKL